MPKAEYTVFYVIFILIAAAERIYGTFFFRRRHFRTAPRVHRNLYQPILYLLLIGYCATILLSIIEFSFYVKSVNIFFSEVGIVSFLSATFIRRSAISALGPDWSISFQLIPKQKIVKKGAYRLFSHPYHFSVALELFGFCLISNAVLTMVFLVVFQLPTLGIRIFLEDRILFRKFGNAYHYLNRKALI